MRKKEAAMRQELRQVRSRLLRVGHLLQLNLALDLMRETDPAKRHYRLRWQPFVARELALRHGLPYRFLDLALSAHTQRLQKLANADVENVLVHHRLLVAATDQVLARPSGPLPLICVCAPLHYAIAGLKMSGGCKTSSLTKCPAVPQPWPWIRFGCAACRSNAPASPKT